MGLRWGALAPGTDQVTRALVLAAAAKPRFLPEASKDPRSTPQCQANLGDQSLVGLRANALFHLLRYSGSLLSSPWTARSNELSPQKASLGVHPRTQICKMTVSPHLFNIRTFAFPWR